MFRKKLTAEKTLVAFDFDGTLTDIDEEAIPVRAEYIGRMANILGLDRDAFEQDVSEHEELIDQHPNMYGWTLGHRIVAASNADPYVLVLEAMRVIMQKTGKWRSDDAIQDLLHAIFEEAVIAIGDRVVFRQGAEKLLSAMQHRKASYIVSGSHTGLIRDKIATLGNGFNWLSPRIRGRAQKYIVSDELKIDDMSDVPETFIIPAYRPLYIRRPFYFISLAELLAEHQMKWEQLLVIGDNLETDGALPLALGARFALMRREKSLQHEVDFLHTHERGMVISSLEEACELLNR